MSILFSWIPIFLAAMLFGGLAKLAAQLMRRTKLSWSHAWIYGGLVFLVGSVGAYVNRAIGIPLPLTPVVLVALLLQLGLGGWYFGPRATTQAGETLKFKGGVLLSLITYLLVVVIGVLFTVCLQFLLRAQNG